VAVRARSCFVSSWRMSHFGIKPVSGGRPPSESRTRGVREVRAGAFAQEVARVLMFVESFSLKVRKVEKVITRYIRRVSRVKAGENCRTRIIQPRWAIEE